MGTENLLSRYVGQSAEPAAILHTLDNGVVIGLDLGRANQRYFLLMMSAGYDAEVIRVLHENRQGNITRASYIRPMLQSIRGYGFPEMQLYCHDGESPRDEPARCRCLFGFNLPLYAMGLPFAPDAVATDGLLDVCTFERGSLLSIIRYWWHVARGSHLALADVGMTRCGKFRVEAADARNVAYQIDGDYGGSLPVDVEILPGELKMLVPRQAAVRLGFVLPDESHTSHPAPTVTG